MPAYKPEECDILLIEAMNKGDLEAMVALYEPNASFVLFDSGQVVTGRACIRGAFQGVLALKLKYTVQVKTVQSGDKDLALTSTKWSATGIDADGQPHHDVRDYRRGGPSPA
jgi:uncharacterized protein (TIGR02246 family)